MFRIVTYSGDTAMRGRKAFDLGVEFVVVGRIRVQHRDGTAAIGTQSVRRNHSSITPSAKAMNQVCAGRGHEKASDFGGNNSSMSHYHKLAKGANRRCYSVNDSKIRFPDVTDPAGAEDMRDVSGPGCRPRVSASVTGMASAYF